MSRYNSYAVKLDEAFKTAREKCRDAIKKLKAAQVEYNKSKENFPERYIGERGVIRSRASAALKEAQENFVSTYKSAWTEFMSARNRLSGELYSELDKDYRFDPDCVDGTALSILNSGLCTAQELSDMASKYSDNFSMRRYISNIAMECSKKDNLSAEKRLAYSAVAKNSDPTITIDGIKNRWYTIVESSNRFSAAHRDANHIHDHADYVDKMLTHWDDVAGNINNF